MSLLKNLATDESIADEKDSISGGGAIESGLYEGVIKLAYIYPAKSGALGLVLHMQTSEGREVRETFWMTGGTAKGGKNYYEKDGQKFYLPGFLMANSLALLAVGKEVSDLDTEEKAVKLWNKEAKTEVPTKVQVLTDLLNKPILAGILKEEVDKTADDGSGNYAPTGETRMQNTFDKFFRASDKKTTAEIRAQAENAEFFQAWENKWKGQTKNSAKGAAGNAGAPKSTAFNSAGSQGTKKPTQSLFA